jgi:hypothetical protein
VFGLVPGPTKELAEVRQTIPPKSRPGFSEGWMARGLRRPTGFDLLLDTRCFFSYYFLRLEGKDGPRNSVEEMKK